MAINKVVIKYLDKKMLKGTIHDFVPTEDGFYLDVAQTNEKEGEIGLRRINISDGLKAIFFVKDFAGRPGYEERSEFMPEDEKRGKRMTIEFCDGERLNVLSIGFKKEGKGFFVNPVDWESNNIRIFIVLDTVKNIITETLLGNRKKKRLPADNKTIVKYLNGRMIKGSTLDFFTTRDFFHLDVIWTNEEQGSLGQRAVKISDVKAIFFVKDFAGRPEYKERDIFIAGDETKGRRIFAELSDGEKLNVVSMGVNTESKGFFVNPVDQESNNIRIFIPWATAKDIRGVPLEGKKDEKGRPIVNKVVVKYLDGKILKGSTLNLSPTSEIFHLDVIWTNEEQGSLGLREMKMSQIKAIFFVKDFAGIPEYKKRRAFLPGDEKRGKKMVIEFHDGEKMYALFTHFPTLRSSSKGKGFFVEPVDSGDNNIRIFVISKTVKEIKEVK